MSGIPKQNGDFYVMIDDQGKKNEFDKIRFITLREANLDTLI